MCSSLSRFFTHSFNCLIISSALLLSIPLCFFSYESHASSGGVHKLNLEDDDTQIHSDLLVVALRRLPGTLVNSRLPSPEQGEEHILPHVRGYRLLRPRIITLASFDPYCRIARAISEGSNDIDSSLFNSAGALRQTAHQVLTLAAEYWPVQVSPDDGTVLRAAAPLPPSLSMTRLWSLAYAHLLVLQPGALPSLERGSFLHSIQQGTIRRSDLWPQAFPRLEVTTMRTPGQAVPIFAAVNYRLFQPCERLLGEAPNVRNLVVGGGSRSGYDPTRYYSINMFVDGEDGRPDGVAYGTTPEPLQYFPRERFEEIVFNHISEEIFLEAADNNRIRLDALGEHFRMFEFGGLLTFLTTKRLRNDLSLANGQNRKKVKTVLEQVGFNNVKFELKRDPDGVRSFVHISAFKPHSPEIRTALETAYNTRVFGRMDAATFRRIQDYFN